MHLPSPLSVIQRPTGPKRARLTAVSTKEALGVVLRKLELTAKK